jgi:hypothetical protein
VDLESEADRLATIRACGGVAAKASKGDLEGIFDLEFIEVEGSPGVEGRAPVFTCRSSDAGRLELRKGATLEIAGATYRVQRLEPDGTGATRLVLQK